MSILCIKYFFQVFLKYPEFAIEDTVLLIHTKTIGFSYIQIIIFAVIYVECEGPIKCGNLKEVKERKKLKNQENKHSKSACNKHKLNLLAKLVFLRRKWQV